MPSYSDLLQELGERILSSSVDEVMARRTRGEGFLLLDVRESEEFRSGHLPGATALSRGFLELRIEKLAPNRDLPIVVYCASGVRSLLAADALGRMGYSQVVSMEGGIERWRQSGYPVEVPARLSEGQRERFQRHLSIPEIGEKGQLKLLASRVLLIGVGGLGSPAAYYLAAAGIGHLGLVDSDLVESSNLQRQILHRDDAIGQPKVESARATLRAFQPGIEIAAYRERLTAENVEQLFQGYDLIVDGSDNFQTRYLINDACVKLGLPFVHGSVFRFEGQVGLFDPGKGGPCYRCLYAEPPPPELAPSCAEAGVLGVLPGVIGLLQAVETIKHLLGLGRTLRGRITHYDALQGKFQEYLAEKDPDCAYCGSNVDFPGYIDYAFFCSGKRP